MRPIFHFLFISLFIVSSFVPQQSDALLGFGKKDHMDMASENAKESAQKAKEAAQKAYEAAKEGTMGFGERLADTAGAAKETASSIKDRVADTVGGAFHGARETASNVYEGARDRVGGAYEGAKDRVGGAYEGAKERVADTAEAIRERAAQMAGMAQQKGEHLRGQADDLYEDAAFRAKHAQRKAQTWAGWFWQSFWDILLFIPRTIGNAFAWAWHTSCDVAEDTYESARDRVGEAQEGIRQKAGQFGDKAGQYAHQAGDYAGRAKERIGDTYEDIQERAQDFPHQAKERLGDAAQRARETVGDTVESVKQRTGQAKDTIGDKVHQAGDYLRGKSDEYGMDREQILERGREMGDQMKERVGYGRKAEQKGWFRCQMERFFKLLLTVSLMFMLLFLSYLFFLSPRRQQQVRQQMRNTATVLKEQAQSARQKAAPYVETAKQKAAPYVPDIGGLRQRRNVEKTITEDKTQTTATPIPVQHHERTVVEEDEAGPHLRSHEKKYAEAAGSGASKSREDKGRT